MLDVEIQFISDHYNTMSVYEIACELCIPFRMVKFIIRNLGLQQNFKWLDEEYEFMKENYPVIGYKRIAIILDRDYNVVNRKLKEIGLKR